MLYQVVEYRMAIIEATTQEQAELALGLSGMPFQYATKAIESQGEVTGLVTGNIHVS